MIIIMIGTLFVLDLDGTYDIEDPEDYGVMPAVYFVPEKEIEKIQALAVEAGEEFIIAQTDDAIGDIFGIKMKENGIPFQLVGSLEISFGERKEEYLADYIPHKVV